MSGREFKKLSIFRQTKGRIPSLPFVKIKEDILGKEYELSLTFPNNSNSIALHKKWKNKKDPVNVLAFPLTESEGEIFITLNKARLEARNFNHSYQQHIVFLFIHACLHLEGMDHGDKMEVLESVYMKKYTGKE